jgi:hypothetical protein
MRLGRAEAAHIVFGALDLWIRKEENEWLLTHRHEAGREDRVLSRDLEPAPEGAAWVRWITADDSRDFRLRPVMPDRAVVVRPESPVSLLPRQSTLMFVGVPMSLELVVGAGGAKLTAFPSLVLSKSWFGIPTEGERCYALRTLALPSPQALMPRVHRIVCSVQVRNLSADVLSFERLCLRCPHLRIYRGRTRFWANVVRLSYRGKDEWSRVVYAPGPPDLDDATELVAQARQTVDRGFLQRSIRRTE